MAVRVTDDAMRVLKRSMELGKVDPDTGGIRLRGSRSLSGGFHVQVEFAGSPDAGDEVVPLEGLSLFIDPALMSTIEDPVVDLSAEHERIVVRSASEQP